MKILIISPPYNEARNVTALIPEILSRGNADNKKRPNTRGPIRFEFPYPMEHSGSHS